jgi:hypothetical protein
MNFENLKRYLESCARLVQKWRNDSRLAEAFYQQGKGAFDYVELYGDFDREKMAELELWFQQNAGVIVFPWLKNEVG